ncbi:hypothetical protein IKR55_02680 [bacterium]|nr:hypothetical protein [bacterium]
MQNFGQNVQRTSILQELSDANAEMGEAVALFFNDMVVQSGITNPEAEPFDVVPESWKKLAVKPDKTPAEIQELDETFKQEVKFLAESYLLYMAKETQNTTGKLDYAQYEAYMLKYRFGHYNSMNKPEYLKVVKEQIKNAFNKIAKHGEATGDELIDKHDMAAFIYALSTKSRRDESGKFLGFDIDGTISPEEYAICDNQLLSADDNLFSVKLRIAYKTLNNKL